MIPPPITRRSGDFGRAGVICAAGASDGGVVREVGFRPSASGVEGLRFVRRDGAIVSIEWEPVQYLCIGSWAVVTVGMLG